MPRYTKQNGDRVPNVIVEKAWYDIPVESNEHTAPVHDETYLIQTRVADYIDLLEERVLELGGLLPRLPIK